MSELVQLNLFEMRDGLKEKTFSSAELTQAHLDQIDAQNEVLNAFIVTTSERALSDAKRADENIAGGKAGAIEAVSYTHLTLPTILLV